MQKSKTQIGFLGVLEKFIRRFIYIYIFIRSIAIKFDIFEEDFQILKRIFKCKKVNIIDIGASDGIAVNFFLKNLNVKEVYCFEPHSLFIKKLNSLKKKFTNIKINKYGISSKEKSINVFIPYVKFFSKEFFMLTYTFYDLNELKSQIKLDFINYKKILIKKVSLKLKKFKYINKKIDLIKIDVNGHEYEIVKSIKKQIKIDKPILIIENNSKIKEISKLLTKLGYKKYYNKNGNFVKYINQNVLDIFFIFKK